MVSRPSRRPMLSFAQTDHGEIDRTADLQETRLLEVADHEGIIS
jgi:hypothetical protein